jgi:integrase
MSLANAVPAVAAATLAQVAGAYLDAYGGRDGSRYHRIQAWVRLLGDKPLAEVTADDVEAAMQRLASEPARVYNGRDADGAPIFKAKRGLRSGQTLNRYLLALGALFSWARRQRILPRNFDSPTRHVPKHEEGRGRVRYLSEAERVRLLEACRASSWPRLHLFVLMALTTGARRGELLSLRWCDVDLDREEALLEDTKNGDRRVLVLLPPVVTELRSFAPRDAAGSQALVFRSQRRPSQPFAIDKVFREAVTAADIRNFKLHDCRHTCASMMAQHGASLLEIADTLGHRQLKMVQRYAHLSTESRRRVLTRVFEGRL